MFTGIIEEIGTVSAVSKGNRTCELCISCKKILEGTQIGDSIAVNGTCLTVTRFTETGFAADVTPETLRRTSFASVSAGVRVNLERALTLSSRLGGHLVSGHIDGTARIIGRMPVGNSVEIRFATDVSHMKYILEKGSVALDGVSLTVAARDDASFTVSVIPHTGEETTILSKRIGDIVNLECDIIGKYIEQLMKNNNGLNADMLKNLL